MTDDDYANLAGFAEDLMDEFPRKNLEELSNKNITEWTIESFHYANQVYGGIVENGTPSDEYIQQGQAVAKRRIALAGYRIADLVRELFS